MWAWTLYREGRFEDASIVLKELIDARNDENDRALRISLAIASGNWDELVTFTADEWNQRERRTAAELLKAGQLAQAVVAPHAKELVTAAAAKLLTTQQFWLARTFMPPRLGGSKTQPLLSG